MDIVDIQGLKKKFQFYEEGITKALSITMD